MASLSPSFRPDPRFPDLFIRPPTAADLAQVERLLETVFKRPGRPTRSPHPAYLPRLSRVAVLRDQVIGHAGVLGLRMRFGPAVLPVAGLRGVAVHPYYRRLGLASHLLHAVHGGLSFRDWPMQVLLGIRHFYGPFGYQPAFNKVFVDLKVADLPDADPRWTARALRPADVPRWLKLYEQTYANCLGRLVRTARTLRDSDLAQTRLCLAPDGQALATATLSPRPLSQHLLVTDLCVPSQAGLAAVLSDLRRRCLADGLGLIRIEVPAGHPLLDWARFHHATIAVACMPSGGPMARVHYWPTLLAGLAPLLAERCAGLDPFVLRLRAGRPACLQWDGRVLVVSPEDEESPQPAVRWPARPAARTRPARRPARPTLDVSPVAASLVWGYAHPADLLAAAGVPLPPAATLELLARLFPPRTAGLSGMDHF